MALNEAFPGPSGIVDSTELRKDLAGLLVRNTDGTPRAGVFYRGPAATIGAARTGDMRIDLRAFNAALVRGGGPLFTQNDGTAQSPVLSIPSSNQVIHVVYAKQNEAAAPYSDGNNTPTFGFVSSGQSATPQLADALALLPDGALPVVSVQVPSTATTTSSAGVVVKDIAPFTALTGGKVAFRSYQDLQAWTTAPFGQAALVYADSTATYNADYTWNGAAWLQTQPRTGVITATTDASGLLNGNAHGLPAAPSVIILTPYFTDDVNNKSAIAKPTVGAITATTFQVVYYRTDSSARLANTLVKFSWVAYP